MDRKPLHDLLDRLPERHLPAVHGMLASLADPALLSLLTAPLDDEPATDEENAEAEKRLQEIENGQGIDGDSVFREFGVR